MLENPATCSSYIRALFCPPTCSWLATPGSLHHLAEVDAYAWPVEYEPPDCCFSATIPNVFLILQMACVTTKKWDLLKSRKELALTSLLLLTFKEKFLSPSVSHT
ncbi:hypothetical protein Leryth_005506 [Lithospermum erythrorhizon]|nr:hypothetical protein Leryth_005506 [Lithospermum erythrorhizon]